MAQFLYNTQINHTKTRQTVFIPNVGPGQVHTLWCHIKAAGVWGSGNEMIEQEVGHATRGKNQLRKSSRGSEGIFIQTVTTHTSLHVQMQGTMEAVVIHYRHDKKGVWQEKDYRSQCKFSAFVTEWKDYSLGASTLVWQQRVASVGWKRKSGKQGLNDGECAPELAAWHFCSVRLIMKEITGISMGTHKWDQTQED